MGKLCNVTTLNLIYRSKVENLEITDGNTKIISTVSVPPGLVEIDI
jgi:hypothetical protein